MQYLGEHILWEWQGVPDNVRLRQRSLTFGHTGCGGRKLALHKAQAGVNRDFTKWSYM